MERQGKIDYNWGWNQIEAALTKEYGCAANICNIARDIRSRSQEDKTDDITENEIRIKRIVGADGGRFYRLIFIHRSSGIVQHEFNRIWRTHLLDGEVSVNYEGK